MEKIKVKSGVLTSCNDSIEVKKAKWLGVFMAVYSVFVVVQNLFEMKTLGTPAFAFAGGGIILSWATFMITDITTELFGKKNTIKLYTIAGILNLFIVVVAQIVIAIPGVYEEQNIAFAQIFSNGIRTALASFTAFWFGNYINVYIMDKLRNMAVAKNKGNAKGLLFFRAVLSTIFGQFVDNMLFATLAFAPIGLSLFETSWTTILTTSLFGTCMESIIESVFVPFITIPVSLKIKKSLNN